VKVHGLIETSSEESDSEIVATHEERVGSTLINMTDTRTDERSGGDMRGDKMATGVLVGSQKSSPETMERLGTSKFSTRTQRVENPSKSMVVKIMSQLNEPFTD
jgi:hypothetical protein